MIDINKEYEDLTIDDVVGPLKEVLLSIKEVPRIVLFSGEYGCGKNLGAYLLAQKLGKVEITVRNTVDNSAKGAEAMISQFSAPPLLPTLHQVCVLNEFTLFQKAAQAKFKDAFQAPPVRTYFFVCTHEPEKIIADVRDRFKLVIRVGLLSGTEAYTLTQNICERLDLDLPKKHKLRIAKGSRGRPRAIINTLEAIKTSGTQAIDYLIQEKLGVPEGDTSHQKFMQLYNLMISGKKPYPDTVKKLMEATNLDPVSIQYKMLNMIYNSADMLYNYMVLQLYEVLLPTLEESREKHDLLLRFLTLLYRR